MAKKFLTSLKLVNLNSDPSVGSEGELYFNSSASVAKIYKSGAWSELGAGGGSETTVSTTEPVSPVVGDAWYKNDTGEFYVYDGTYWVEVNGVVSLTQEQVQDYVAPLFTHNNHVNASVHYEDELNELHIEVTSAPTAGFTSTLKHDVKLNGSIAKGQAVYVSSANGTNIIVSKASNTSEATSSKTLGLLETGGSNNAIVKVVTEGLLAGLNTSTATAGDPVWLGTDGNLIYGLVNKPFAPAHLVFIGIVSRVNSSNGEIFVKVQNGFELEEIHNIGIGYGASIQNNEVLAYNSASGFWINKTADEAGLATVDGWEYDSVINIRSYDGITDGAINLEGYLNAIRLSDDNGVTITTNSGSANFAFNNSGELQFPDASIQNTAFLGINSYSTSNISEGTNLYFTDERAQDSIGNNLGTGLLYNDTTGAISNSGALSLSGTANEISVSASTGNITIGIPDSPVFVTPNIGVATATSVNGTTIPSSKTLVVTTDIGSTVQGYDADLASIAALTGTSGLLTTNGSGTWSVDTNTYSTTSHNHTVDSLSNVVITSATDGQALVWDSSTSKWINETISSGDAFPSQTGNNGKFLQTNGASVSWQSVDFTGYLTETSASTTYLTKASASTTYQPAGSYLTSESDTLSSVTSRGATTSSAVTVTNATAASSTSTGALVVTGGVGIGEDLYVNNNVYIGGDINITGSISGSLTYVNVTDLVVTDPLIYLAESNPDDSVDIGIFAALNHGSSAYYHAGLIRDASDSGKWKLASQLDDPINNVIDFTSATFDTLKIGALEVTNPSTTRTNLGLAIGSDVQAYNSTLASVANGTYSGDDSITTVGTISSGTWNGTTIGYTKGGTGLTSLGSAGYVLKVNSSATGLEWGAASGGGSSAAAVTSDPPASPELNQVWQDLDTGRIYVWNGDFWIEVQQNGSLGLLRYLGASSTAPATSIDGSNLQVGEVYFDTVFNGMKVYDGSGWEDAFSAASLSVSRWVKTVTGGQTSLSGNDDNSVALSYTPGIEEVYLNGVKLIRGSDYIGTSGSVISNLEPLSASSVVEVISYSGFTVANTYTKTEVDDLIQKKGVRWTKVAGVGTSITTLSGLDDYGNTLSYTPGTEQVFVNGILIARSIDYTAGDGASVVLGTALAPGDIVEVVGNTAFSIANTYTKAEVDAKTSNYTICTSLTRPSSPTDGQMIYETDTDRVLLWHGSSWRGVESPGSVIQYQSVRADTRATYAANTSGNGTIITPLNVIITPKRANSMIVVEWVIGAEVHQDTVFLIHKNGSVASDGFNTSVGNIRSSGIMSGFYDQNEDSTPSNYKIKYVDYPNTTSAVTYSLAIRSSSATTYTFALNRTINGSTGDNQESMVSFGSAMEVAV